MWAETTHFEPSSICFQKLYQALVISDATGHYARNLVRDWNILFQIQQLYNADIIYLI